MRMATHIAWGIGMTAAVLAGVAAAQEPAKPAEAPTPRDLTLSGTVTDAAGKAVPDALVGQFWQIEGGRWTASRNATTGTDGTFALPARVFSGRSYGLCAFDAGQTRGAWVTYTAEDAGKSLALRLEPLAAVTGTLTCKALARIPAGGHANLSVTKSRLHLVGQEIGTEGRFAFRLPPGTYDLGFTLGLDFQGFHRSVTVGATGAAIDLGEIEVAPSVIAQHYGKAPPAWQPAKARNLPDALAGKADSLQPGDFAGKWVLVEFWGYW